MSGIHSFLGDVPSGRRMAMVGTYPPRKCGIATFSNDLSRAVKGVDPSISVDLFAMSDKPGFKYPPEVRSELSQGNICDYYLAADLINEGGYEVLSIQHEFGIFGGLSGAYLLDLIRKVEVPIVTTLHTVLDQPSLTQKLVLEALADKSERLVVMSEKAIELLRRVHQIEREKIDLIPHGIPMVPADSDERYRLGVPRDQMLILTFGLLSPDKGIRYMIEAMPKIIERHPGATYAIIGATHPHIVEHHGETYREELFALAEELGVSKNVKFVNEYVSLEDLIGYLSAMDIYCTPYLKPQQITSGTLAYAVGAGKPIISTPYWHAEELLADDRGILVQFKDSKGLADAAVRIADEPALRRDLSERTGVYGRKMLWPEVGDQYLKSFERAGEEYLERKKSVWAGGYFE